MRSTRVGLTLHVLVTRGIPARFVEETKKDNASSVVFDSSKGPSYLVQHYPMKRARFFGGVEDGWTQCSHFPTCGHEQKRFSFTVVRVIDGKV